MSDQELADVFSTVASVKEAKIIVDRMSGRSRGFGFVTLASAQDAQKALALNGKEIKGRAIFVSEAREKTSQARR
jgi:cold-inducible RNA-binding protein